jgi:hypothetical protein
VGEGGGVRGLKRDVSQAGVIAFWGVVVDGSEVVEFRSGFECWVRRERPRTWGAEAAWRSREGRTFSGSEGCC